MPSKTGHGSKASWHVAVYAKIVIAMISHIGDFTRRARACAEAIHGPV